MSKSRVYLTMHAHFFMFPFHSNTSTSSAEPKIAKFALQPVIRIFIVFFAAISTSRIWTIIYFFFLTCFLSWFRYFLSKEHCKFEPILHCASPCSTFHRDSPHLGQLCSIHKFREELETVSKSWRHLCLAPQYPFSIVWLNFSQLRLRHNGYWHGQHIGTNFSPVWMNPEMFGTSMTCFTFNLLNHFRF